MFKRHNPEDQRAASSLPYSVLLQMGFTLPVCYHTAGALLPHRSTLTTCVAVHISVALSLELPPPDVIRHLALRSSDFPLMPSTSDCLSYSLSNYYTPKYRLCQYLKAVISDDVRHWLTLYPLVCRQSYRHISRYSTVLRIISAHPAVLGRLRQYFLCRQWR